HIIVDRKADVHCFRRVHAEHIEIKGRMSGEIIAQSVTVHRKGSLEGDVAARSISVEKGGMFSGQLAIGQIGFAQGELLGKEKPTVTHLKKSPTSWMTTRQFSLGCRTMESNIRWKRSINGTRP